MQLFGKFRLSPVLEVLVTIQYIALSSIAVMLIMFEFSPQYVKEILAARGDHISSASLSALAILFIVSILLRGGASFQYDSIESIHQELKTKSEPDADTRKKIAASLSNTIQILSLRRRFAISGLLISTSLILLVGFSEAAANSDWNTSWYTVLLNLAVVPVSLIIFWHPVPGQERKARQLLESLRSNSSG
jgi:hypothetical protein